MRIAILGLGLIGGSLALKLHQQQQQIIGLVRDASRTEYKQAPFEISDDWQVLGAAEIFIICTPISAVQHSLQRALAYLPSGCIISDVASVKLDICSFAAEHVSEEYIFIPGHPLAGTEHTGFPAADPGLFAGRPWVLCPTDHTPAPALQTLEDLLKLTGARLLHTTPEEHDSAVALISHLPLLLSLGLDSVLETEKDEQKRELARQLASSGFEGMVRLARGNRQMNSEILSANLHELQAAYQNFCQQAEQLLGSVSQAQSGQE